MAEIGRLLTAMVTPFDEDGNLDEAQIRSLSITLLESGSDGLVVGGTTGEAPTLSHQEKLELFAIVKDAVSSTATIIAGTGTNNTAASIKLSREAEQIGVNGLLLTVPYYNKPTQDGLQRHFSAIAGATRLPCVLYNIPSRTGVNMTAQTTLQLARDVSNIVGIKEASGDLVQIATIIEGAPKGFRVWSGDDAMTLPILAIGGYGVIGVSSHLVGNQMKKMIHAYLSGSRKKAADIHRELLPLIQVLMTAASNPTPVKYALNQIGFPVGPPRLPLVEPDEETGEKIMAEVRKHHIDLPLVT